MPTIIQGIIIFMNEFDFTTTFYFFGTRPCLTEVGLLSIIGPSNSIVSSQLRNNSLKSVLFFF